MSNKTFSFEKLDVWKKSRVFLKMIYLISQKFPEEEKFGLTSQIRRSANSIAANIAEGSARVSSKEQARFTEIAFSSLMETLSHLLIATDLEYIKLKEVEEIRPLISEISNKLNALRKFQLNN